MVIKPFPFGKMTGGRRRLEVGTSERKHSITRQARFNFTGFEGGKQRGRKERKEKKEAGWGEGVAADK